MIIANKKYNSLVVIDKETKEPILKIDNEGSKINNKYALITDICTDNTKEYIAQEGDFLFFENNPEQLFIVYDVTFRTFSMANVVLDESNNLTINQDDVRVYPNNKWLYSLSDFKLKKLK